MCALIYHHSFSQKMNSYFVRLLSLLWTNYLSYKEGVEIGKKTIVYHKSKIVNSCKLGGVKIGESCKIGTSSRGYHSGMPFYTTLLNDGVNSKISVGSNCRINGAYIHAQKEIEIGNNCVIAAGVSIMDSNGHEVISSDRTKGRDIPQTIKLGDNVWVGLNVIILKNTLIGDNCVVAAGSVVKGIFPENSLIMGNPVRIVKTLNIK